jgi:tricorn protease
MVRALTALAALALCSLAAESAPPLLVHNPTMNKTTIVFVYAGDLWSVPRSGGDAVHLTTGPGIEDDPLFSPDGSTIAFTGEYDGNVDIYVVDAGGGVPKRLTYHPGRDSVIGWTPDSKNVLFRSARSNAPPIGTLYTVPVSGGFPARLDLPFADRASYSPDGKRIAYIPEDGAFAAWKRYRGGRTSRIWLADTSDLKLEKVPRDNSNDWRPMWIGNKVYFLSDRSGPFTLFSYDVATKKVTQALPNTGYDIKSATAGPDGIVYEQFGSIHIYDLKTGKTQPVEIRIAGDIPSVRPAIEKVARNIRAAGISPTGARAIFEARGEVLTVPAEKGDARNLTNTPGVRETSPSWSPDGKKIAYFSDDSGEYALHVRNQTGIGDVQKYDLGKPAAFYYVSKWSPDSKKVLFTDNRLSAWYMDLEKKPAAAVRIDMDTYHDPTATIEPAWSPDSKWVTYTKVLKNHLRAVFLYSLDGAKIYQVSDGMSDTRFPAFDKNGKYLYFMASTNTGMANAWLDMSSLNYRPTQNVYVAVLSKDEPSPLAPESDEEKADSADKKPADKPDDVAKDEKDKSEKKDGPAKKDEPVKVKIDPEGIGQRILALPIPARSYVGLLTGKTGILFLGEIVSTPGAPPAATTYKFDLKTKKTDKFLDNVREFDVSFNGEKALYRQGDRWAIVGTATTPKPDEGTLKLDGLEIHVDPKAEWAQMYREVWRIERDFFYDPGHHGLNLDAAAKRYEPFLASVAHRADLTYLFQEMLGELSVGHLFVAGGAYPEVKRVRGGLLGADYKIENGRYRFERVFNGENWNPQLKAPLTQPGVNVVAGEYLLAVNGRELRATDNIYQWFEATAGKSVVLRVGPNPTNDGSREVTVVPIENETGLRTLAWIESNRRKVDQMTGGRVAYVYLPNTANAGYENFNRYYFAQVDKQGAVIDERFNGGGQVAEYIVDYLNRPLLSYWSTRYGQDFTTPQDAIFGPKAMLINEYAGSGGDMLPWMFRHRKIGPLIGRRTWGGLVGMLGFPPLVDGGFVTAPNLAFWNPFTNEWDVENHGVTPDIEVEYDPAAVKAGHDPQLERAVQYVLAELQKNPPREYHKPAYPNYHKSGPLANSSPRPTVSTGSQ